MNVPALPDANQILLDATTNLLVDLPVVNETPTNVTGGIPTVDEEGQPMDATIEISANVDDDELIQGPRTRTHALKIEKQNSSLALTVRKPWIMILIVLNLPENESPEREKLYRADLLLEAIF